MDLYYRFKIILKSIIKKLSRIELSFIIVVFLLFVYINILGYSIMPMPKYPKQCYCGDENFCLPPIRHLHPVIQSKFFDCKLKKYLADFNLMSNDSWLDLNQVELDAEKVVFVTAAKSNTFKLARGFVCNLRSRHPDNQIIFYDLGLNEEEKNEVKLMPNVTYKPFEFEKYPPHVSNVENYSWKVLIIAEQLLLKKAFFYMDGQVGFNANYSSETLFGILKNEQIEPYAMLENLSYSIYARTNPDLYHYIPMSNSISKKYLVDSASAQLILPVNYTRTITKWQLLCALTPDCIAPENHKFECFYNGEDEYNTYQRCHRYDQSVLNSLMIRSLIGEDNLAKKYNYTSNWPSITTYGALNSIMKRRRERYQEIYQMYTLDKDKLRLKPVDDTCYTEMMK